MVIKLLTIDIHFPGRASLKEKRIVLSSVKAKLRRQFNVAVAEVDYHNKWQRSLLAIVTVGVDGAVVDLTFDKILKMLNHDHRLTVLDCHREIC
ncbi:MAG: DUF503 domain-containing protein [Candidatus Krumholzibacteria bacterium]